MKQKNTLQLNADSRINFREKLSYGLGDVAANLVWASVTSFLTYYYTNYVGLAAAAVGTILFLSRILDGFSDILMGTIIDKTHSRFGKARPWLLWMAFPFAIAAVLPFLVPNVSDTGKIIYVFITYNILATVIYTALLLPYGTMNTLITTNQQDRASLNIYRMIGSMFCTLAVNMAVLPIVRIFGNDMRAWQITFIILGLSSMILWLLTFAGTRERVVIPPKKKESDQKFIMSLKQLIKNKYWVIMIGICIAAQTLSGFSSAAVYYAQYWLGNSELVGVISMASLIPVFILLFFMLPLINKFGKRNCMLIGTIIHTIGNILQLIAPGNLNFVIIANVMKGIGLAPMIGTEYAMLADVIDYNEYKTNTHTEGIAFSAASFGNKVGTGLGAAIVGWALALGKFDAALATQSASAMASILWLTIYLPIAIDIIIILLLLKYDLDKKYPQFIKELEKRRAEQKGI